MEEDKRAGRVEGVDEKSIRQAAEEAINDLELDCEIREVCRSPGGDEWCVQFSSSYSQLCDKFQDQFKHDNSQLVVREKIKRHLLKQVDKLRRSTGKFRRPRAQPAEATQADSNILTAPLKMIGDVIDSASQVAGSVMEQATGVANAARQTVANMGDEIAPIEVLVRSPSSAEAKKPRKSSTLKTGKAKKAQTKRAVKTPRKASGRANKQTKKAGKIAAKSGSKTKKAGAKKTKKARR